MKKLKNPLRKVWYRSVKSSKNSISQEQLVFSIHRERKTELIKLLKKLREVSVFADGLPKEGGMIDILGGAKGHLIYLMAEIVDCARTKEPDLIEACKEMLMEYAKILLGKTNS